MATKKTESTKISPPSVSFDTFKRFIETLGETVVPTRIDRGVLPKMSGVTQSQLTMALKFFDLIDANGTTKQLLRGVVKAHGTEGWSQVFGDLISGAYEDIIGDVHLNEGTANELRDAFRSRTSVEGQNLVKAIRFYLKACANVGWSMSPHFKAPPMPKTNKKLETANNGGGKTAEQKKRDAEKLRHTKEGKETEGNSPPTGMQVVPLGGGRRIAVEADITPEDVTVIESLLPALKAMAARHTKGGSL